MLKRWLAFFLERYAVHAVIAGACVAVLDLLTQSLMGVAEPRFSAVTLQVILTWVLLGFAIRCSDELRDMDTDERYFPDRPLVSGRIAPREVVALAAACVIVALVVNLGWNHALPEAIGSVIFLALLSRWWFMPQILSGNRFLAVLANLPFFYCLYLYAARASASYHGLSDPAWVPWGVAGWMLLPLHSYEFARKSVTPSEEKPGYQTYSALIGFGGAALLAFGVAALHYAVRFLPLGWAAPSLAVSALLGLLVLAFGVVALRCLSGRCRRGSELESVAALHYLGTFLILGLGAWGIL